MFPQRDQYSAILPVTNAKPKVGVWVAFAAYLPAKEQKRAKKLWARFMWT
jgi:hypothetical protein